MRIRTIFILALVLAAGVAGLVWGLSDRHADSTAGPHDLITRFTAADVARWDSREVDGETCRISPVISSASDELNLHRITVDYAGTGEVKVALAHNKSADLNAALTNRYFHGPFHAVASGDEVKISSPYKGERHAWILLQTDGDVRIEGVGHHCYRGKGTLYGHIGLTYPFGGAKLPYRLMIPKDYDPEKAYPLVLSVAGSGSVGTDNARNMEMVILARFLFTKFYEEKDLQCFSLVPQIPTKEAIPAPYYPKGSRGAPTAAHPDWPAVNEQGFYTQATLALIRALLADPRLNIDPDRVYFTGFSYGGKACWEFLKADPDLFAGALCGAGWPIGRARSKPTGPMLNLLAREVRRYKDVPVWIFAGGADAMRYGSIAVHKQIQAAGGLSKYTEMPRATHVPSAAKIWSNPEHIRWLFKQKRETPSQTPKSPIQPGTDAP